MYQLRVGTLPKSVRISIDKLDTVVNLVGELVIHKSRLVQIGREHKIEELGSTMAVVERTISDLQYEVTQMRMIPVEHVFNRFPKLVRDLYRAQGKELEFIIEGKEIELDRTVLDEIVDPIVHLLRNSVDHGIELPEERERKGKSREGKVTLAAKRETGHVTISVEDDGKGMDANKLREKAVSKGLVSAQEASKLCDEDVLKLIFMPGFSTAEKTTEVSGRGVGMGVVKTKVEALGGLVDIQSEMDMGTKIMLKLLVDILLGRTPGETKGIETEMEVSALTETGNILASSFCSAIADLLQFTLMPSPPSFAFDMAGAMVEYAIIAVAQAHGTEHIILFKCDFQENENEIYGYILLFPHPDSLKSLLSTLE